MTLWTRQNGVLVASNLDLSDGDGNGDGSGNGSGDRYGTGYGTGDSYNRCMGIQKCLSVLEKLQ